MEAEPPVLGLGTRLRHVLELLDSDVAQVYADLGLSDYRPRFSPVVRALVRLGPSSIRDLARAIGVTSMIVVDRWVAFDANKPRSWKSIFRIVRNRGQSGPEWHFGQVQGRLGAATGQARLRWGG